MPRELEKLIKAGKEEIYHFRLDSAQRIFQSIQQKYPDYPHGYFYDGYVTAVYFSQDKSNDSLDAALHETVSKAVEVGKKYKSATNDSPESLYYLGVSHGILGIYHVVNRSYLRGYLNGRKGKGYLEKVIEADTAYYDAYLGLGIFHYYVDILPGIIKFFAKILGFGGDREQGINEILLTATKGQFFRIEAEFVYAAARYFFEGREHDALQIYFNLQSKYPDNPALTLLIAYHYRRHGNVKQAIKHFTAISQHFKKRLPQILVMKYYNLGVCHFRLNDFETSELYFNKMMDTTLRKTRYYIAALTFYKGLLADLDFDSHRAKRYYRMIRKNKDTQYWYNYSRVFTEIKMDSMMYYYILVDNYIFTRNISGAERVIKRLMQTHNTAQNSIPDSDLYFLIFDVRARLAYIKRNFALSVELYSKFIDNLNEFNDDFQRSWIYIHYARVLREMKNWALAETMLKKAESVDDDYTHFIIDRERFIIRTEKSKYKTTGASIK